MKIKMREMTYEEALKLPRLKHKKPLKMPRTALKQQPTKSQSLKAISETLRTSYQQQRRKPKLTRQPSENGKRK